MAPLTKLFKNQPLKSPDTFFLLSIISFSISSISFNYNLIAWPTLGKPALKLYKKVNKNFMKLVGKQAMF